MPGNKKIAVVVGTRPGLIKLAPVLRELKRRDIKFIMIRTGQHYSDNMWDHFIKELEIPVVGGNDLQVCNCSHGKMVGLMLQRIDAILIKNKPDLVIVQGDDNSALAGALTAAKLHIPVAHIEAGLRSFDKRMPEEHNRILIDHVSTYLFPPTPLQFVNLQNEGLAPATKRLPTIVGNTIADSLNLTRISGKHPIKEPYAFVTFHREENVDCPRMLSTMMEGVNKAAEKFNLQVVFPVHPRTKKKLLALGIKDSLGAQIKLIDPLSYTESLRYQKHAAVCITDSGGVVEESCILGTPSVVVRKTTDRPEAEEWGASITVGEITAANIVAATGKALQLKFKGHPYGKFVTDKILHILLEE